MLGFVGVLREEGTDRLRYAPWNALLRLLRAMGVQITIDDFGAGHSSLTYLKRLPADYLKIDHSFISGIGEKCGDTSIVEATIRLSRALGLKTIAEGVETREQLLRLREMGCKMAQGFYFSKPLPNTEIPQILKNHLPLARS